MPSSSRSRSSITLTRVQRRLLLLLLLPLGWLMYQGWLMLSAALLDYQSAQWISHWQEQNRKQGSYALPYGEYQVAVAGALRAFEKQPYSGDYAQRVAVIADWYVLRGDRQSAEYPDVKKQALSYFQKVTELKPQWPEAWFDLAFAKARQRQLDDEFSQAFIQSLMLGPWESRLQARAADLSFLLFDYVEKDVQRAMQENVRRMAGFQPRVFWRLVKQRDALATACLWLGAPLPEPCNKLSP